MCIEKSTVLNKFSNWFINVVFPQKPTNPRSPYLVYTSWDAQRIGSGRLWPYMWPPVAAYLNRRCIRLRAQSLMVVANIKLVWFLPATSMIKSPNLIVSLRSPQVAANCRWSPPAKSTINPTKGGDHPQFSFRWLQVTAVHTPGDLGSSQTKKF